MTQNVSQNSIEQQNRTSRCLFSHLARDNNQQHDLPSSICLAGSGRRENRCVRHHLRRPSRTHSRKLVSLRTFFDEGENEMPEFLTHLSNIKSIKCSPLSSAHGNYTGGVVQIVGVFGHFVAERITLKVGEGFYKPLVAELKTLL